MAALIQGCYKEDRPPIIIPFRGRDCCYIRFPNTASETEDMEEILAIMEEKNLQ